MSNFFKFQSIFHNDNPMEILCQHSSFNLSFTSSGVFSSQHRCLNVFCLYIIMKKFVKFALPTLLFLYECMPFLVLDPLHFSYMLLFYCSPSLFATISIAFIYWLCCMTWLLFPDSRFSWLLQTHCISFIIQEERETDERLLRNEQDKQLTRPIRQQDG